PVANGAAGQAFRAAAGPRVLGRVRVVCSVPGFDTAITGGANCRVGAVTDGRADGGLGPRGSGVSQLVQLPVQAAGIQARDAVVAARAHAHVVDFTTRRRAADVDARTPTAACPRELLDTAGVHRAHVQAIDTVAPARADQHRVVLRPCRADRID